MSNAEQQSLDDQARDERLMTAMGWGKMTVTEDGWRKGMEHWHDQKNNVIYLPGQFAPSGSMNDAMRAVKELRIVHVNLYFNYGQAGGGSWRAFVYQLGDKEMMCGNGIDSSPSRAIALAIDYLVNAKALQTGGST